MRVLLVIDRFGSGGAQTQIALLARGLLQAGCEVAAFTYHPNEFLQTEALLEGVTIIATDKTSSLCVVARLARVLQNGGFDAVVAFLTGPSAYATAARCLTNFRGKVLVSERNIFRLGRPTTREWLQRLGHHAADLVVANSKTQAQLVGQAFPLLRSRLYTIANGVDVNYFAPGSPEKRVRGSLLAVGRIVEEKNTLGLARALAALVHSGRRDVRVRWVGKVHSVQYFEACRRFLHEAKVEAHWSWEGEQSQVRDYYHQADWLVLPSFQEGMPNVIGEALACGLPCVASNVSDASWLMDQGRNGYLFAPSDDSSLVSALTAALCLPEQRRAEIGHHARTFAQRELSVETMVCRYLDLLRA